MRRSSSGSCLAPPEPTAPAVFEIASAHHTKWDTRAGRAQPISLVPLDRGSLAGKNIFTMGSCFALELRHELAKLGYATLPRYTELEFDPAVSAVGLLPERDNINHYNVVSILQELENVVRPESVFSPVFFYDLTA